MNASLAINGGPKAKTTPYSTGLRYTGNERQYLEEALASNTLFYGFGKFVKCACDRMREYTGQPHVVACSSCSAAIHLGLIAAGIGPGDEVILTPNTDVGSVIGIIGEGAVPVFCDCDWTLQPTVATVAAKITPRTKAVVVVHIAGYPAPVDAIVAFCQPRGIAVVEDCAQSWGTKLNGRQVGAFGTAGCFSTNDFKHISTGDGGFVALNDAELYRRVSNYADKHYDRLFGGTLSKAHFGMNYRMTELQGAVACAQLEIVDRITSRHHELGERLTRQLADLKGARMMPAIPGAYVSYWWTLLIVEDAAKRDEIAKAIAAEGVNACSYAKYDLVGSGLFQTRSVRPWLNDERAQYPLGDRRYNIEDTPTHKRLLETGIQVMLGQFYSDRDIDEMAAGILKVCEVYAQ